jgi:hypothetical protein
MRRSFITAIFWLVLVSSASATTVELPVTPTNLDTYGYVFSVLTNAIRDGVTFHVTITDKKYDIYPDSGASVDIVTHKKLDNGGLLVSSQAVEPAIQVTLEKEVRVWKADFVVSRKLLKNPDVYFVFSVLAHSTINGKSVPMPSLTCYQIRLQDFAKP